MLQGFFVLAVLSNVAFCVAYPVDLIVQCSDYGKAWSWVRAVVLVIGTLFACVIAEGIVRQMLGGVE